MSTGLTEYEEAVDKVIDLLREAAHGELLDECGNRDENGLNWYPNLKMIKSRVETALTTLEKL